LWLKLSAIPISPAAPAPKLQNFFDFFDFAVKINRYQRSYAHTNTRPHPHLTTNHANATNKRRPS
jgi:hypothetical protein